MLSNFNLENTEKMVFIDRVSTMLKFKMENKTVTFGERVSICGLVDKVAF